MEEETWKVINAYFEQFPNWIAQHQIDSYNDFINNKIPLVFKNKNKRSAFILDKENPDITYEVTVYLGGRDSNRYKLCLPSVMDHATGKMHPMYPNEARLKNLTYALDIFYDIDIDVTIRHGDVIVREKVPLPDDSFLRNNYLGKIPIMLKSSMCVLNKVPSSALPEMGESEYEYGGYFVIDGREKIIMSQERKAENIIFLSKINDTKFNYTRTCEVKAISDEAFEHARTNKLMLETAGAITLRIGQQNAFISDKHVIDGRVERRDVPLFVLFRLLGIETDEQIIRMIAGDITTDLGTKIAELLRPSAQDRYIRRFGIYSKQMAENYLEPLTSRSQVNISGSKLSEIQKDKLNRLSFLYDTIRNDLLPHVGSDHYAKACYLAYMARRLLLFELGLETETSRDSFMNKRVDMSGFMLATLFKDSFSQVLYSAIREIKRKYEFEGKEFSGDNFLYMINENTYKEIFKYNVFDTEFSGALKKGSIGNKNGVVQQIDRLNYYSALSHIRRVTDPVTGGRPQDDQRRINVTQYGYLCPCESPEGQSIGLRKALSVMTTVTIGYPTAQLKEVCYKLGCIPLKNIQYTQLYEATRVLINGNWIGNVKNPNLMVTMFRLMRRNGLINAFTSIAWYIERDEIVIFCDNGRLTRPLYVVEGGEFVIQGHDIKALATGKAKFTDFCFSRIKRKDSRETKLTDYLISPVDVLGLSMDDIDLDLQLRENQCAIEYIDVQESDTRMLTQDFELKSLSGTRITHAELHPTMILGALAQISTRIDAGSSGKYLGAGASKHPKQSVAMYASNFQHRIDTSAHLLHNAERALIRGRLTDIVHHDKMGTGVNICVALAYYNGYNQEDAIIGNSTSIDMGLFNSSYYKMYEDFEIVNKKSGQEERFYNPLYNGEIAEYPESLRAKKGSNFDNLDKFGFVKEGTRLDTGDEILIGKYMKTKDEKGLETFADVSKTVKHDNIGSYVDKVYTCPTNAIGDRLCKVRTCKFRKPEIGDKFSSRNGQKGTFGILIPREDMPFTDDGIVPDMILHPSAYPKRMTLNQLLEMLLGTLAVELGLLGLAGSMEDFETEKINDILTNTLGLTYFGDRVMYNGVYGEQMPVSIFMGPLYIQRLKYMVADKINAREPGHRKDGVPVPGGAYTVRERQVVSGRANGGGIKMGEMERDALISHGVFSFLNERDMVKGDKFIVYVSTATGEISVGNPESNIFYDQSADGPLSYHLHDGSGQGNEYVIGLNTVNKRQREFVRLHIPYAMKLLIHEMNGMGMRFRMKPKRLQMMIEAGGNSRAHIEDTMLEMDDIIATDDTEMVELLQSSIVEQLDSADEDVKQTAERIQTVARLESAGIDPKSDEGHNILNQSSSMPSEAKPAAGEFIFRSVKELPHPQDVKPFGDPSSQIPGPPLAPPAQTAQVESKPQIPEANPVTIPTASSETKQVSLDLTPSESTTTISSLLPATDLSIETSSGGDGTGGSGEELLESNEFSDIASKSPAGGSGLDGFGVVNLRASPSTSSQPIQPTQVQQPPVPSSAPNPEYKTISITANPNELSSMGLRF